MARFFKLNLANWGSSIATPAMLADRLSKTAALKDDVVTIQTDGRNVHVVSAVWDANSDDVPHIGDVLCLCPLNSETYWFCILDYSRAEKLYRAADELVAEGILQNAKLVLDS